jgi:FKBP-type peptidyl-prolyl cis-trans isomerase
MSEVTAVPLRPIKRGSLAKLWVGIAALVMVGAGVAYAGTKSAVMAAMSPAEFLESNARKSGVVTLPSGLQYEVLSAGKGPKPGVNDIALVEYDGRLASTGESFDSTEANGGGPVPMPVAQVVPGFSEGLQQMQTGGKYRLWIKPELGYGARDVPDPRTGRIAIPANSVLVFDVTLVAFQPGAGMPGMMAPGHGGM